MIQKVFKIRVLHFGHLNINSILPKIKQLKSLLINSNSSVLRLTETKLDNTVNNKEVEIVGYNLTRSNRNKMEGGIPCYIQTSIPFNYHGSPSENFEKILIDILLPKSKPIDPLFIPLQASFIDPLTVKLHR